MPADEERFCAARDGDLCEASQRRVLPKPKLARICKWCGNPMLDLVFAAAPCELRIDSGPCEPLNDPAQPFDVLEALARRATAGLIVFSMPDGGMVVAAALPDILELIEKARRA